jgi:hypothetical protein
MIGNHRASTGRAFDGLLDEARIMHVPQNGHWAKLECASQREGQRFLTSVE